MGKNQVSNPILNRRRKMVAETGLLACECESRH